MTARQIDESAERIHDLNAQGIEDLVLAFVAAGLALTATQVRPAFAMPFLLGALGVGFLGVRALVLRTFMVEDLAGDRDAYVIPAVQRFGQRAADRSHRHDLARSIRVALTSSSGTTLERLRAVQSELDELAALLEDDGVAIDAYSMILLDRWLRDPGGSFRNPAVPVAEVRSRLLYELAELDSLTDP